MQTVNLKVDQLTGNEIIIREGKALEQKPPEKIELSGDIKSVSAFLKTRNTYALGLQFVDIGKAVVEVDKANMTIVLNLDPENHYGASVTGKLELSDELKKWFINQAKTWKLNELTKHLRFNRIDFDDYDKHANLLAGYQSFNFKTYIESQQEADQRGNKKQSFEKKVETGLPVDFVLNIPIFKGHESQRFHVEICLETTEGSANFWFESTELHELINTQKEIIFNEQLKSCEGFVIINK
jgi:hypothetical protein